MKFKTLAFILTTLVVLNLSCDQDETFAVEYGKLNVGVTIDIEVIPNARQIAVDTDDFKLTIFDSDGQEFMVIDPFSSFTEAISLPTGEYFVEATSNNLQNAAFEEPFYFGRTDIFTIDKEEEKYVEVNMTLANTQVSILWSDNVVNSFSDYYAEVILIETEESLLFTKDETRYGYFISAPLLIQVTLEYEKNDGTTIVKSLSQTIDEPLPKTHYRIHVNASLQDGEIVFHLNVDEDVDIVDIDLVEDPDVVTFSRFFGGLDNEYANSMTQLEDGSFVVAGGTLTMDHTLEDRQEALIAKFDESGNMIWEQLFGGPHRDNAISIDKTMDGGFVVGGYSDGDEFIESVIDRDFDFWVFKLDSSGELLWQKFFGGSGNDLLYSIKHTSDGGYIGAGISQGDAWIIKLDATGSLSWEKSFGGSGNDCLYSMIQTPDGGFIGTGYSGNASWVIKLDNFGNLIWQKTYGGETSEDAGRSIRYASDGGYITCGWKLTDHRDGNVMKLNSNGGIEWKKTVGGSGEDHIYEIEQTVDGGFVFVGYSDSNDGDLSENFGNRDVWLAKLNPSGSLVWQKSLGGSSNDLGKSICISADGGYLISGDSESLDGFDESSQGGYDFLILKVDEQGNL